MPRGLVMSDVDVKRERPAQGSTTLANAAAVPCGTCTSRPPPKRCSLRRQSNQDGTHRSSLRVIMSSTGSHASVRLPVFQNWQSGAGLPRAACRQSAMA